MKQDLSEFQNEFNKKELLKCLFCGTNVYGFNSKSTVHLMNSHVKRVHENRDFQKSESFCPHCYKSVKSSYIKKHIEMTHSNSTFICEECGKSLKTKHQMRLHVKTHSIGNVQSSKCEVCDELIPLNTSLQRHMYQKHGGRKFNPVTCEECGKQLGDKSKLRKHKDSIHLHKKPFQCDICKLTVSRSDNLKQHKKRVHNI